MAARQHSARPSDDPRTRHLLRRHGPHHRPAQHDHDELHLDPASDRGLAAGRLHHRVLRRQRRGVGRQPEAHRDARHKPRHGPRSSTRIVVHHPSSWVSRSSPQHWSAVPSRTAPSSRPGWSSSRCGRSPFMQWWPTGFGRQAAGCSSLARWTTRAAWPSKSSPVCRPWLWLWCSAPGSVSRRTPCARTTCPSCCSVSACCGSAGSGSTPVPPWPPAGWQPRSF